MKWVKRTVLAVTGLLILGFSILWIASDGADGRMSTQAAVTINRAPEEVFPWLVEPDKLKLWIEGLVDSQPLTAGGVRVGARSREIVEYQNQRMEMETEIIALEPNRDLVVQLNSEAFDADARYHLVPEGNGTLVRYSLESRYRPFFLRLILPMIESSAQAKIDQDLDRLKRFVEQQT